MITNQLFLHSMLLSSRIGAFFSRETALPSARFAKPHELTSLLSSTVDGAHLLLGEYLAGQVLRVKTTPRRPKLGNMLICGPTGSGKSQHITSQLLTWPHSAVVYDIKGELYRLTAGARRGKILVLDPTGVGHQYDPFQGRVTESKLYAAAKNLLYEPREGDGRAFAEKGMKMLTVVFLAAREANRTRGRGAAALLPFVGSMADLGLNRAAHTIHAIAPDLARRFLDEDYRPSKDYTDNKFLASSWESVTARLYPLLTSEVLRMLAGSDFTGADLMRANTPVTVYLRMPEADLLALSPITRLVLDSLIQELITTYDRAADTGEEAHCRPVLFLIDEAGRTASLGSLPDHLTTVRSRGISIMVAIQTLSQLTALYHDRAEDVINNCLSQLYYQPFSYKTAAELTQWLGYKSAFATSYSTSGERHTSEARSEREVPLMPADEIRLFGEDAVLGFCVGIRPFLARRMNWRRFPLLRKRAAMAPPPVPLLPQLSDPLPVVPDTATSEVPEPEPQADPPASFWHVDRSLYRRWRPDSRSTEPEETSA